MLQGFLRNNKNAEYKLAVIQFSSEYLIFSSNRWLIQRKLFLSLSLNWLHNFWIAHFFRIYMTDVTESIRVVVQKRFFLTMKSKIEQSPRITHFLKSNCLLKRDLLFTQKICPKSF